MSQIKYNNKTIKKLEHNASEVNKMYYDGDIAYGVDGGSQPIQPIYRWWEAPASDYICDGTSKYYKEYYQVSYDNGSTWQNVTPEQTRKGDLIEAMSTDCGYVPPLYNEYEYIKTVGTATTRYTFNTGFYPTTAHTIELKIQLTDNSVDWGRIFGWSSCDGDSCDSTQYRFTTVTGNWALIARRGNASGISYKTLNKNINVTCTIPISSTTNWYYTTGTYSTVNSATVNSGTFNSPSSTPLHLLGFGDNTWGTTRGSAHLKYYYLKVYDENHNLVKHYVASDYNGVPCFYEKVNGEYIIDTYTGSNHGTLTLGNPVN